MPNFRAFYRHVFRTPGHWHYAHRYAKKFLLPATWREWIFIFAIQLIMGALLWRALTILGQ
jgi:hypothetical protein